MRCGAYRHSSTAGGVPQRLLYLNYYYHSVDGIWPVSQALVQAIAATAITVSGGTKLHLVAGADDPRTPVKTWMAER